tara:strand:- start:630 stop:1820 length:1191 start_codon:yes stop_codon:yes gene_type:complete
MLTKNELLRIKILEEYDILDTVPEEMFDEITAIAAAICNVPIAFIGLIDDKRQFLKSRKGLDVNNVPIEQTVCHHMIKGDETFMEIPDLRLDDRFKDNPYVHGEPNFVSYSGAALTNDEGTAFGTICVMDYKANYLNETQKTALRGLSNQVVHLLELRRSNQLLNTYQDKLEEYTKDIEDFTYTASHDLKAPIRGIDSFLKLLEEKNTDQWDQKDKKYLGIIHDSCDRMNSLITDLMTYARSGIGEEQPAEINIRALVENIFSNITLSEFKETPVLTLGALPSISSYRIPLQILFQNIIENGIKYQAKDNVPHIEVSCNETARECIFEIRDNGIGIEQSYLDTIYKPFQRLHSQSEYSGSGLGLAACKKVVDQLKGKLWATSSLGVGTTFFISLPK